MLDLVSLAHFHAAVLRLPCAHGVLADTLFPSHIFGSAACLNLLQRGNNLRIRVPAFAHLPSPSLRPNRIPKWTDSGGQITVIPTDIKRPVGEVRGHLRQPRENTTSFPP